MCWIIGAWNYCSALSFALVVLLSNATYSVKLAFFHTFYCTQTIVCYMYIVKTLDVKGGGAHPHLTFIHLKFFTQQHFVVDRLLWHSKKICISYLKKSVMLAMDLRFLHSSGTWWWGTLVSLPAKFGTTAPTCSLSCGKPQIYLENKIPENKTNYRIKTKPIFEITKLIITSIN